MSSAYYGYFRAGFFLVGFVEVGGRLVRMGFYRNLGELEREVAGLDPRPSYAPDEFENLIRDLERYFSGEPVSFDYPYQVSGTGFQRRVWEEVRKIPYGEVRSYRWIAGRVGRPRAWRAAANALKNNPLVLVIPCHRVVRSDGRVAGSGFGRRVREYLLRLEGAIPAT